MRLGIGMLCVWDDFGLEYLSRECATLFMRVRNGE